MDKKKFYITTSIAYTNAPPHIGYALELIQADVIARYHKLLGEDVLFLTGTDEHGAKVVKAAQESGKEPKEFTDEISDKFKELTKVLNISSNDFIRTTDQKRHWPTVQKVWSKLKENGDIEKKQYKGLYCVGCEAFITKKDLIEGKCKIHQQEPEVIEEENWFFKLSNYSKQIEELIEKDEVKIVPEGRKNEMLSFIRQGLEDVSFSRPRKDLKWGIPVPDDDTQTIYVWADALINYISALGSFENEKFKKYWPADIHFVGKDILRFHATIWLGMLLSLKLPLPKNIFVHGFITSDGQKMSKSLGNIIDPFELVKKYGADAVRYFLLREIPPSEDGDFTYEKFEQRYNADLANGIGNLVARVLHLALEISIVDKQIFHPQKITRDDLKLVAERIKNNLDKSLDNFEFNETVIYIWDLISYCDKYLEEKHPWNASPNEWEKDIESKGVVRDLVFLINEIAKLLRPFLPETAEKIFEQLKGEKIAPLFPRI